MADPIALQIGRALAARLEAITIANGFNTNAGQNVFLGFRQVNPEDIASAPAVLVYETEDTPRAEDGDFCATGLIDLLFSVDAIQVYRDAVRAESLARLWQDLARALFLPDQSLGGLAVGLQRGPRTWEYPEQGGATVAVRQGVIVSYIEPYGQP